MCNLATYNNTQLEERHIKDDFQRRWYFHNEEITINCMEDYHYKIGTRPKSQTFVCQDGIVDIGECHSK